MLYSFRCAALSWRSVGQGWPLRLCTCLVQYMRKHVREPTRPSRCGTAICGTCDMWWLTLLDEQRPVVPRGPRNVLGWAPDTSLAHDRGALGLCKVFGLDVHGEAFVALRLAQHTREQLTINRTTVLLNTGHAQGGCVREEESRELSHGPLSHVPLATWLAMSSSCHAVTMAGLGSGAACADMGDERGHRVHDTFVPIHSLFDVVANSMTLQTRFSVVVPGHPSPRNVPAGQLDRQAWQLRSEVPLTGQAGPM